MAYDRPSPKFLSFLARHYCLTQSVPQVRPVLSSHTITACELLVPSYLMYCTTTNLSAFQFYGQELLTVLVFFRGPKENDICFNVTVWTSFLVLFWLYLDSASLLSLFYFGDIGDFSLIIWCYAWNTYYRVGRCECILHRTLCSKGAYNDNQLIH